MPTELNILIMHKGPFMVARSLEFDIAAQGRSFREAFQNWCDVFIAQIQMDLRAGRQPLSMVPAAPKDLRDYFEQAFALEAEALPPPMLPDDVPREWQRPHARVA